MRFKHMFLPTLGLFCATVSGTTKGYPRQINRILGQITLLSEQAKGLGVSPSSRLSSYLEHESLLSWVNSLPLEFQLQ